jgi:hypothetical protein
MSGSSGHHLQLGGQGSLLEKDHIISSEYGRWARCSSTCEEGDCYDLAIRIWAGHSLMVREVGFRNVPCIVSSL